MTHPPTPEQAEILTPCIEFEGKRLAKGYGCVRVNGKNYLAHRLMWESHNGAIPKGMCICHKCDNPRCWNIDHLFLGSYQDNIDDMFKKGRNPSRVGSGNGRAILCENDVREIHNMLLNGFTPADAAKRFMISVDNIRSIKSGFSWKHIYKELFDEPNT